MRRVTVFLALGVLLAACGSQFSSGEATSVGESNFSGGLFAYGDSEAPSGDPETARNATGESMDVNLQIADDRRVIRNARLQLHATDTRDTFDEIVALTASLGGFVANAEVSPEAREDVGPSVSVTLRIPAASLDSAMQAIKELADEVVFETQNAQDVSEQFVDLEARLANLEAFEAELRALLEEVRRQPDADPDKLLRVFNELSGVRGQIEQLQGQLNYLSDLTAMATLSVGVSQTPAAVPIVKEAWAPAEAVRDAARNLITALQTIANWVISFVIYTLPVLLLVLVVPVSIGIYAYRRWWKNRSARTPMTPAES